jgi:hypothetical protein
MGSPQMKTKSTTYSLFLSRHSYCILLLFCFWPACDSCQRPLPLPEEDLLDVDRTSRPDLTMTDLTFGLDGSCDGADACSSCVPNGYFCGDAVDCCSGYCHTLQHTCQLPPPCPGSSCLTRGEACSLSICCCSFICQAVDGGAVCGPF